MFYGAYIGPSVMDATFSDYKIVIPDIKDAGCIGFLPCCNDGHIENLLGASVRRVIQDYTEVGSFGVLVSASN